MNTISIILEPDADGSLHLPLPEDLRHEKIKVTATLEPVKAFLSKPSDEEVMKALKELRSLEPFKAITDPVAWQREIRKDRPLSGRD